MDPIKDFLKQFFEAQGHTVEDTDVQTMIDTHRTKLPGDMVRDAFRMFGAEPSDDEVIDVMKQAGLHTTIGDRRDVIRGKVAGMTQEVAKSAKKSQLELAKQENIEAGTAPQGLHGATPEEMESMTISTPPMVAMAESGATTFWKGVAQIPSLIERVQTYPHTRQAEKYIQTRIDRGEISKEQGRKLKHANQVINQSLYGMSSFINERHALGMKPGLSLFQKIAGESKEYLEGLDKEIKENYRQFDGELGETYRNEGFAAAAARVMTKGVENLPQLVVMAVTGTPGLSTIGAGVAADKVGTLDLETNLGEGAKLFNAMGTGLIEVVSEKFGTMATLKNLSKTLTAAFGKDVAIRGIKFGAKATLARSALTLGVNFNKEGLEEAGVQWGENLIDILSGAYPYKNPWQGVVEAYLVGGLIGLGFAGAQITAERHLRQKFGDEKYNEYVRMRTDPGSGGDPPGTQGPDGGGSGPTQITREAPLRSERFKSETTESPYEEAELEQEVLGLPSPKPGLPSPNPEENAFYEEPREEDPDAPKMPESITTEEDLDLAIAEVRKVEEGLEGTEKEIISQLEKLRSGKGNVKQTLAENEGVFLPWELEVVESFSNRNRYRRNSVARWRTTGRWNRHGYYEKGQADDIKFWLTNNPNAESFEGWVEELARQNDLDIDDVADFALSFMENGFGAEVANRIENNGALKEVREALGNVGHVREQLEGSREEVRKSQENVKKGKKRTIADVKAELDAELRMAEAAAFTGKELDTKKLDKLQAEYLAKEQEVHAKQFPQEAAPAPKAEKVERVKAETKTSAPKESKYPFPIYKGDVAELEVDGDGISFFTRDKDAADYYTTSRQQQGLSPKENKTFEGFLDTRNPLIVDAHTPSPIELIDGNGNVLGIFGQGDYIQKVKEAGYDSIIINKRFGNPQDGWEIVSFNRNQIKPRLEAETPKAKPEGPEINEFGYPSSWDLPKPEQVAEDEAAFRAKAADGTLPLPDFLREQRADSPEVAAYNARQADLANQLKAKNQEVAALQRDLGIKYAGLTKMGQETQKDLFGAAPAEGMLFAASNEDLTNAENIVAEARRKLDAAKQEARAIMTQMTEMTRPGQSAIETPRPITVGFVYGDTVYINEDAKTDSVETYIHEFGHLHNTWLKQNRPEVYQKGIDLVNAELASENSEIKTEINYVKRTNPELEGEALAEEILTQLRGKRGARLLNKTPRKGGIIAWLKKAFADLKKMLGLSNYSDAKVMKMTVNEWVDAANIDLLKGERIGSFDKAPETGNELDLFSEHLQKTGLAKEVVKLSGAEIVAKRKEIDDMLAEVAKIPQAPGTDLPPVREARKDASADAMWNDVLNIVDTGLRNNVAFEQVVEAAVKAAKLHPWHAEKSKDAGWDSQAALDGIRDYLYNRAGKTPPGQQTPPGQAPPPGGAPPVPPPSGTQGSMFPPPPPDPSQSNNATRLELEALQNQKKPFLSKIVDGVYTFAAQHSLSWPRFKRFFKTSFRSSGKWDDPLWKHVQAKEGGVKVGNFRIGQAVKDFQRAIEEVYDKKTRKELPVGLRYEFSNYLKGDRSVPIDPRIAAALDNMRRMVAANSFELVKLGVVDGELAIHVLNNSDFYLTRSYEMWDHPSKESWQRKVPQGVVNRATAAIRSQVQSQIAEIKDKMKNTADPAVLAKLQDDLVFYEDKATDIEGEVKKLLNAEPPDFLFTGLREGAKDTRSLREKQDLDEWLRDLWGEYHDPIIEFTRTAMRQMMLIENHKFLSGLRQQFLGDLFFENPKEATKKGYNIKLASADSPTMKGLVKGKDIYTSQDIVDAFANADKIVNYKGGWEIYMMLNGYAKYGKTVLDPAVHMVNFQSNFLFMVMNLHSPHHFPKAVQALRAYGNKDTKSPELTKLIETMLQYNLIDQNVMAGELGTALDNAFGSESLGQFQVNSAATGIRKFANYIGSWYQAEDNIFKVMGFMSERNKRAYVHHNKSYEDLTPEQQEAIDAEAAGILLGSYPMYNLVIPAVKAANKFPLFGTFASFPSETVRVTAKTLGQASNDFREGVKTGNNRQTAAGIGRIIGVAAAFSASYALAALAKMQLGIDDDEEKHVRGLAPEYYRNTEWIFMPPGKDKDGNDNIGEHRFVNWTRHDVTGFMKEPWRALLLTEGEIEDRAWDALWAAMEPFAGEELLLKAIEEARIGKTDQGRDIYNELDPWHQKYSSGLGHIIDKALTPGGITRGKRLHEAYTDEDTYLKVADEWYSFFGAKVTTINHDNAYRQLLRQVGNQYTLLRSKGYMDLSRGMTPEQATENVRLIYNRLAAEAIELTHHYRSLGGSTKFATDQLDRYWSRQELQSIFMGKMPTMVLDFTEK